MLNKSIVTINLTVYNGEKYIRQCLDSVLAQTYPHELIEINILDNASTDSTVEKINNWKLEIGNWKFKFNFVQSKFNLGMWPAQEELLKYSHGKYVIVLSVDVILHPDFLKNAIGTMERDPQIGALQAKVYKYELTESQVEKTNIIDTIGFKIYRSRRIVNIGHGEEDKGQHDKDVSCFAPYFAKGYGGQNKATQDTAKICYKQIFAVEGAVPVFRRQALETCRLQSQLLKLSFNKDGAIVDPDFFWYGDDLDLAWRMRIFGWKQVYAPSVIAWHDRKTTKSLAGGWKNFIKIRKLVPLFKRRLDWRNTTLAIIKNDFASNILRDLSHIFWRQLRLWGYFLIFEPAMFIEIFNVAKMLPKMLKRRREIMQKDKISAKEFRKWIT